MADLAHMNISHAHTGETRRDDRGPDDGWFRPCHGSIYDTSERIRQGATRLNLAVPACDFTGNTTVKIG
jgi:ubiquinol-cytochrome c reductase iron-sulfur subunit